MGFIVTNAGDMIRAKGEGFVRKLFGNGLTVGALPRQQEKWLDRGKYSIAGHSVMLVGFQ